MQHEKLQKLLTALPHTATDAEHLVGALVQKHFGQLNAVDPTIQQFVNDLKLSLRKHAARLPINMIAKIKEDARAEDSCEEMRTIRNLQNLVVRLRREADGSILYVMREGRLAGSDTTSVVRNKPLNEYLSDEELQTVLPQIQKAFEGETVHMEYSVGGRSYIRHYAPLIDDYHDDIREVVGSLTDISGQKEIERQLRSSEHLFRMVIDNVPVGILKQEVHADGHVHNEVVNAEFQRISGYSVDELWNMSAAQRNEMIHREDRENVRDRWLEWMAKNDDSTLRLKYRFQHRNGAYRIFQNYMVKFHSEEGNLVCVQAVMDITGSHENEKQLRHLASYLEQSVTPIFEVNAEGEVTYANAAAEREFKNLRQLNAQHPLLQGFDSIKLELHEDSPLSKRMISVSLNYYDQHFYYMPEAQVYRVFCHNVTTMKLAEEELRESLEKERALSLLRSTFLDTISHEFRTPLTGISISAELLQRYDENMSLTERGMHIQAIRARVQELVSLVSRFTTQSNLHTMRDTFSPVRVDVVPVLRKIIEEVRSAAVDRKQLLVYDFAEIPAMINGDERLLRHAIRNILLNAVQYSTENSAIQIRVHRSDDDVRVTVIDEGMGIPEDEIERLFTPYYRGTNGNKAPGSGLGISIAKEFIELHGGSVEISSRVGIGTTVMISLPLLLDDTDVLSTDSALDA